MMNKRVEFILLMLSSLFLTGVLMSVILQGRNVSLTDAAIITLVVENQSFPLKIGLIPLRIFFLVWSLLCLLWIGELFGKREGIFLSLAGGMTVCFVWLLLQGIPFLPVPPEEAIWDATYNTLFGIDFPVFASTASQIAAGFTVTVLIFELCRKLTHGGFLIIRLFVASLVGIAVPPVLEAFFAGLFEESIGSMVALLLTRYLQWFFLFLLLTPVYYILLVPLKLVVGKKHREEVKERFEKKKLFGPKQPVDFFESHQEIQENRI